MLENLDKPQGRTLRVRGAARKEKLLNTACELLARHNVTELAFKDIYECAGVPAGSAYHFFNNMEGVFAALKERFSLELTKALDKPLDEERILVWEDIGNELIDRVKSYYSRYPAARRALLQTGFPHGRIYESARRDGKRTELMFDRYFVLPEISDRSMIFIFAVKIVNLIFAMSCLQEGQITEEMCSEAKTAALGYLRMYLPERLARRSS